MKKQISILLAAALLASSLAACGKPENGGVTTSAGTASDTSASVSDTTESDSRDQISDNLPDKDFGGAEFRISCMSKYSSEMDVDQLNGDVCNDAVYNRNRKIEDRFNIKIKTNVTQWVTNESYPDYVKKTVLAGEDAFDIAGVYTYLSGSLITSGCYRNWYDVPYVDFSKPWWVQSCEKAFSVGDKMYVAVGDLSVTTLLLSYGIFMNKTQAENYNLPNMYDVVRDGKWTIDYLNNTVKDIYKDLNGNNESDEEDFFGFAGEKVTNLDVYPSAFDISITKKDADNLPVIEIDTEKMQTAVEKVYNLYYNTPGAVAVQSAGDEIKIFADGRALFLTTFMNNAFTTFRDMKDDYGILPYPKFDEKQTEYYTNSMDNYSLLGIPKTAKNLEMIGIITEALNAESYKTVMPAYYNVALSSKYTRDDDSLEMLDIIMKGRNYDFSILHGTELSGIPYVFRNLLRDKSTDFASKYASIKTQIASALANIITSYEEQ